MTNLAAFGSLLLLSTALTAPAALAQSTGTQPPVANPPTQPVPGLPELSPPAVEPEGAAEPGAEVAPEEQIEISGPGAGVEDEGAIIVTGRNIPNVIRRTPQVVAVLSAEDIARTGEGDIAGALQRVTGVSVVGGRFVFVRGLGERYSLALLNGAPLPSPEPLRRTVPLDIFPTAIVASSVVQKSYSVAYPGEFGGGVINLTTRAVPHESFLEVGGSVGFDTETTFQLGYTYFGSETDWTSFDGGERGIPAPLQAALATGDLIVVGPNFTVGEVQEITASLSNARTSLVQRNFDIPADIGANVNAGTAIEMLDGVTLGIIGNIGYSNSWQTKGGVQQLAAGLTEIGGEPGIAPDVDYDFLSTENRILLNGLLGLGLEWDAHRIRFTNLYIRDVLKEARIQEGVNLINVGEEPVNISNTAWFERQLFTSQAIGEFRFGDFGIDLRGAYAKSQRDSPYERTFSYRYDAQADDFVNDLRTNGQFARVAFSELDDVVWSGALDLSYALSAAGLTLSAGYSYLDNERSAIRRDFRYTPRSILPFPVTQLRPDFLLSDFNIFTYDIVLTETSGAAGAAAYEADLRVHAVYGQAQLEIRQGLDLVAGVRYEDGRQSVTPIDLFGTGGEAIIPSVIEESYFLPAATMTWNFAPDMQARLHASKTIARPQFRELAPQQYLDTETDRTSFGNQFLTDSELINAEARYEWFFGRDQRLTVAAFYKDIQNPIEAVAFQQGGTFFTTFANAPAATLYGAEFELQHYQPLDFVSAAPYFVSRRLLSIVNYTYANSKIKVSDGDTTIPVGTGGMPVPAANLFDDGERLTGQSDHLVNLQLGLESTDRLSQQTILLTYSSERVSNRGLGDQPDLIEEPGLRLDFVWREGVLIGGREVELKFEARNLTGENYEEYQELNQSRIDTNTYDLGRRFSLGASVRF